MSSFGIDVLRVEMEVKTENRENSSLAHPHGISLSAPLSLCCPLYLYLGGCKLHTFVFPIDSGDQGMTRNAWCGCQYDHTVL